VAEKKIERAEKIRMAREEHSKKKSTTTKKKTIGG